MDVDWPLPTSWTRNVLKVMLPKQNIHDVYKVRRLCIWD
jgi:hypothetical protein